MAILFLIGGWVLQRFAQRESFSESPLFFGSLMKRWDTASLTYIGLE